jgi:Protein of unknown function (DUF3570)
VRLQLKPTSSALRGSTLRQRLMAASCALLSSTGARAQAPEAAPFLDRLLQDLSVDSALAYYHEDGRIQAIEPVVDVAKTFANGDAFNLNFTFDSLSGSSPNGALPSHSPQTFTSPSGKAKNQYVTAPGQLPVDPNYHDDRIALSGNWTMPVTRVTAITVGAKVSGEDDFLSLTLSASVDHDFNQKNTTVSAGVYDEFDSLRPIGGAPEPGSDYALADKTGNRTKDGIGGLFGITQVMTRNWLSALNFSVDRFHGYLNDPYKFTSVLDASGAVSGYQYESRPDQRLRKSAYLENRAAWDTLSMGFSLRYMSDDWAVRSETAQVHVRWQLPGGTSYIEPTVRWYRQTAAEFYVPWLVDTAKQVSPYQSSDSRLDAFHALTYGVKYAHKLGPIGPLAGSEFNVRLEYYQQKFHNPSATLTELQGLNPFPDLKAVLVQLGWRF